MKDEVNMVDLMIKYLISSPPKTQIEVFCEKEADSTGFKGYVEFNEAKGFCSCNIYLNQFNDKTIIALINPVLDKILGTTAFNIFIDENSEGKLLFSGILDNDFAAGSDIGTEPYCGSENIERIIYESRFIMPYLKYERNYR